MTCFWDGLMKGIINEDYKHLGKDYSKKTRINLINILKSENRLTKDIMWNGKMLIEKELRENYEAVKNYDIEKIGNGHLCSTCDYMLLLICDLFKIDIEHKYLNNIMRYTNSKNKNKIYVKSNKGHFMFQSRSKKE